MVQLRNEGRGAVKHRVLTWVCLTAVTSLLATACAAPVGSGANETEAEPVTLYASLGLSGSSASITPALEGGMRAAIATINDKGGLLGREMKLDVENNESTPTKAVSNLQKRIKDDSPELVWAGSTSSETLAMLGLTTREKIISLNNGSAPEVGVASNFPYSFSAGVGPKGLADYLAGVFADKGYKTVGLLLPAGASGDGLSLQYKETLEAAGIKVIAERYELDAVEMDGPLARIREASPDAVMFNDFVHPGYVLKSRVKMGMGGIPFVGDSSTTLQDFSKTVSEEEKQGVLLSSFTVQTTAAERPGVGDLLAALNKANVSISTGLYLYALAYDTVLSYANAVESVGSLDVEKIRSAMEENTGGTYRLALTDDFGWTQNLHLGNGKDPNYFTLIPVSSMSAGQFQLKEQ